MHSQTSRVSVFPVNGAFTGILVSPLGRVRPASSVLSSTARSVGVVVVAHATSFLTWPSQLSLAVIGSAQFFV
jgi:hypothetical protein